jgi:hypothetical protein
VPASITAAANPNPKIGDTAVHSTQDITGNQDRQVAKAVGQHSDRQGDDDLDDVAPDVEQTGHLRRLHHPQGVGEQLGPGKNQKTVRAIADAEDTDRRQIPLETAGQAAQGAEKFEGRVRRLLRVLDRNLS